MLMCRPVWTAIAAKVDDATGKPIPGASPGKPVKGGVPCTTYIGADGAGHYVKMVHNGIEYGIMAAYAEGMAVLKAANVGKRSGKVDAETTPLRDPEHYQYDLDLADISEVWRRGSVIASWLLDLQAAALIDNTPELLLLDVTPHSLGIMIVGGYFHRLIEQNTTIPTRAGHVFTTVRDNQTSVKILVLQGESDKAAENEMLGEFILSGLRRAPRGQVEVEVTFSISVDGIVSVSAKDLETGREQSITVTATSGLTEDELKDLVKQSQSYMIELRASEESERRRQQAEKLIDTIRGLFPQVQEAMSGTRFGRDAIAKAEAVVVRAEQDLARSLHARIDRIDTIEHAQQRALAATARTDHRGHAFLGDIEAHVLDRVEIAVVEVQATHGHLGRGGRCCVARGDGGSEISHWELACAAARGARTGTGRARTR